MFMKSKLLITIVGLYFVLIFLVSCSSSGSSAKDIGKVIYDSGCNQCHDNSIICLRVGRDNAYWKKTVLRMSKKVKKTEK